MRFCPFANGALSLSIIGAFFGQLIRRQIGDTSCGEAAQFALPPSRGRRIGIVGNWRAYVD